MTADELHWLQETLCDTLSMDPDSVDQVPRAGPTRTVGRQTNQVRSAVCRDAAGDEAIGVMTLLGAVAVAIAWWTHRAKAAPEQSIRQGIEVVGRGHPYLLPIPRHDPCFCGSETPFRTCHGQPPNAVPLTTSNCIANTDRDTAE